VSEKIQCNHKYDNGEQCGNKKLKKNIPEDKREDWKCHQHRQDNKTNKENRRNSKETLKEKAAEMLANPDVTTNKEVYTTLDIPESTFYDWMNDQNFIDRVNDKISKYTDRALPDVWKALIYNAAEERETKAIKLFFEMKNKYKQSVEHSGEVTNHIKTDVQNMTDEELREEADKYGIELE